MFRNTLPILSGITVCALPSFALAEVSLESQFIFNTLLFLIGGFLVMFMAAGFTCLEAGMVRSTGASTICLKNIALYSIASLMYLLIGYNLMYTNVAGEYFGSFGVWHGTDLNETIDLSGNFIAMESTYAAASGWFFQMVFVATAASIVSGTIAERVKLWPFLIFCAVLTGIIYPIAGSWKWGAGWLDGLGFSDFAGSTIVHSVGGWAALVAVLMVGPRKGRFTNDGRSIPMPASSIPLATIGTFILWFGWFGFNGASQLAMGSALDASSIANIFVNTNMAACGGVLATMIITQFLYKKVDTTLALNGALAGLVSITADPLTPTPLEATAIGAVGGVLMIFATALLDRKQIDDVVGAIPVHLVCGIWGTIAVPLTNPMANFQTQAIGIAAYGFFTIVASYSTWLIIRKLFGMRITDEMEAMGIDMAEVGLDAYPDFIRASKM